MTSDVRETHCAVVLLLGDRAYKVKKPVDLGFLDFRDVAERRAACRREVELNRRLAPDVYLGVGHVSGLGRTGRATGGGHAPDAGRPAAVDAGRAGQPVDDATASARPAAGELPRRAGTGPEIAGRGRRGALRAGGPPTCARPTGFRGRCSTRRRTTEIERLAAATSTAGRPLLPTARPPGLVVDGHGDLVADDIFCLPTDPGCSTASSSTTGCAGVDVLDDVAFLAMDLERSAAPELAARFLRLVRRVRRRHRGSLRCEHHYIAYRAFVRAKVACLQAARA